MKYPITPGTHPYNQAEAFCLMFYKNEETGKSFFVWNSRDGVTPFCVIENSLEYRHMYWEMDRCLPDYVLTPGQRYFRDITEEESVELAKKRIAHFADTPHAVPAEAYEEVLARLAKSIVGQPRMVAFDGVSLQGKLPD